MRCTRSTVMQVECLGVQPAPRRAAASCAVGNRWLLMHGGFDGRRCLSDFFMLDTEELIWSRFQVEDAPSPRALHCMCCWDHGVFLYGGACNSAVLHSAYIIHNRAATAGKEIALALDEATGRILELESSVAQLASANEAACSSSEQGNLKVQAQAQVIAAMQKKVDLAVQNSKVLAQKLAQERSLRSELQREARQIHADAERACLTYTSLVQQLKETQRKLAESSVKLEMLESDMAQWRQRGGELEKERQGMVDQLHQKHRHIAALEAQLVSSQHQADVANQQASSTSNAIKEVIDRVTYSSSQQIAGLTENLLAAKQSQIDHALQNKNLTAQLEALERERPNTNAAIQVEISCTSVSTQYEQLDSSTHTPQDELDSLRDEVVCLREELSSRMAHARGQENELKQVKLQLEEAQADKDAQWLQMQAALETKAEALSALKEVRCTAAHELQSAMDKVRDISAKYAQALWQLKKESNPGGDE